MQGVLILGGALIPLALAPGEISAPPRATVARDGDRLWVHLDGATYELAWRDAVSHFETEAGDDHGQDVARAPMPGAVVAVLVGEGAEVAAGDGLLVIESMKLETTIRAPRAGTLATLHVAKGDTFDFDAPLVTMARPGA